MKVISGMMLILLSISILSINVTRVQSPVVAIGIGVYWDSSCTNRITSIDWGILRPGSIKDVNIYIRNEGNVSVTLSKALSNLSPPEAAGFLSLHWNYIGGALEPSGVVSTKLSLSVSSSTAGIYAFSFDLVLSATGSLTASVKIATHGLISRTWIVDDDGPADFTRIQDAIGAASSGDTIFVRNGTYYEHLTINKSISLVGEGKSTSIVDGSRNGSVMMIMASNVSVSGLTIQNGYYVPHVTYGVRIGEWNNNCRNVAIYDNIISLNDVGVFVYYSSNATVSNNTFSSNWRGISVVVSGDNHIEGNSFVNNEESIQLGSRANGNLIIDNNVSNSYFGILVGWSKDNDIIGNAISLSVEAGIRFDASNNSRIIGNTITSTDRDGIVLFGSNNNTIIMNELIRNKWDGIAVWYSNANLIYHSNFQTNAKQAGSYSGSTNTWDNGYPSGGNYWTNYAGVDAESGPNQDQPGSDGVGDTPYSIDANNTDRYPLVYPFNPRPWDLTGVYRWVPNGWTDIRDILLVAELYGSSVDYGQYDRRADLTGSIYLVPDLKIDIRDLALVAKHFGETYS